ncbi:transposase [Acinetobacter baumannii]
MHLNCDEDSFSKRLETTPANVHDSQCFTTLLTDDESAVYADSAYKSQAHDDYLAEHEPPIKIIFMIEHAHYTLNRTTKTQ